MENYFSDGNALEIMEYVCLLSLSLSLFNNYPSSPSLAILFLPSFSLSYPDLVSSCLFVRPLLFSLFSSPLLFPGCLYSGENLLRGQIKVTVRQHLSLVYRWEFRS